MMMHLCALYTSKAVNFFPDIWFLELSENNAFKGSSWKAHEPICFFLLFQQLPGCSWGWLSGLLKSEKGFFTLQFSALIPLQAELANIWHSCCNLCKMSYCCRPLGGQGCNAEMWRLQSTVIKRQMQLV